MRRRPHWGRAETGGADTAATNGTLASVTAANAKGAWAELIASAARDAGGLILSVIQSSTDQDALIDIGVGGAGSESVIAANLCFAGGQRTQLFPIPIAIPAGSRVAYRFQCTNSAVVMNATVTLLAGDSYIGRVDTYGANTADSGGVSVDPGAVAHTVGEYSELAAALTYDIRGFMIGITNQSNTGRTACQWLARLGVGAALSEQVIMNNIFLTCLSFHNMWPMLIGPIWMPIPAGSRVALAAQCSITDATDRLFDAIFYGLS